MFERFTHSARKAVVYAQDEARAAHHTYIGTEHLLLGLLREQEEEAGTHSEKMRLPSAASILNDCGVTLDGARDEVQRIVGQGDEVMTGQIPFTPRAKKVLELALREAISYGNNFISTTHVLAGLLREGSGVACKIIDDQCSLEKVGALVRETLQPEGAEETPRHSNPLSQSELSSDEAQAWVTVLSPVFVQLCERLSHREDSRELLDTIRALRRAKDEAIDQQDYQRAADLRAQERAAVNVLLQL